MQQPHENVQSSKLQIYYCLIIIFKITARMHVCAYMCVCVCVLVYSDNSEEIIQKQQ